MRSSSGHGGWGMVFTKVSLHNSEETNASTGAPKPNPPSPCDDAACSLLSDKCLHGGSSAPQTPSPPHPAMMQPVACSATKCLHGGSSAPQTPSHPAMVQPVACSAINASTGVFSPSNALPPCDGAACSLLSTI